MNYFEECAGCPVVDECNLLLDEIKSGEMRIELKRDDLQIGASKRIYDMTRVIVSYCTEGPKITTDADGNMLTSSCRSDAEMPDDLRTRFIGD